MERSTPGARVIGVSDFRRRCLELLESVRSEGMELVITKHGRPVARITPMSSDAMPLRGMMRGKLTLNGDIVEVDWSEEWEALR